MTTRLLVIFYLINFLTSCRNGDSEVCLRYYSTNRIKEKIFYNNKLRLVDNIGFDLRGDTLRQPSAVYDKSVDSLFIFVPADQGIEDCQLMLGVDSARSEDASFMKIFHGLTSSLHRNLTSFNKSLDVYIDPAIIALPVTRGVIKCRIKKDSVISYQYFPVDL